MIGSWVHGVTLTLINYAVVSTLTLALVSRVFCATFARHMNWKNVPYVSGRPLSVPEIKKEIRNSPANAMIGDLVERPCLAPHV